MRARHTFAAASLFLLVVLGGCGLPGGGSIFPARLQMTSDPVHPNFTFPIVAGTLNDAPIGFTVRNDGLGTATGITFSTSGPTGGTLTIGDNTCSTLARGQSCTATLLISGTFTGSATGSLTVSADAPAVGQTKTVTIQFIVIGP
jgi:hypothetical protein